MINFINPKFIEYATKIREDAELKIVQYDETLQYIISTPIFENFESFVELSKQYPVFEPSGYEAYNPMLKQYFSPQHLNSIQLFIKTQLENIFKKYNYKFDMNNHFSNIFHNLSKFKCPLGTCFPHTDSTSNKIVAVNFWISANNNDATSLWKVKDNYFHSKDSLCYIEKSTKIYSKENAKSEECTDFFNLTDYMDIKKVVDIPAKPNTISMYFSDTWHSPKFDMDGENLRWSYVFFYGIVDKD